MPETSKPRRSDTWRLFELDAAVEAGRQALDNPFPQDWLDAVQKYFGDDEQHNDDEEYRETYPKQQAMLLHGTAPIKRECLFKACLPFWEWVSSIVRGDSISMTVWMLISGLWHDGVYLRRTMLNVRHSQTNVAPMASPGGNRLLARARTTGAPPTAGPTLLMRLPLQR